MKKIVFVCVGNTCRSPMAQGIFQAMNGEQRTGFQASSAGLFAYEGMPASEYAIQAAAQYGADLSKHHARQLTREIVEEADYLFCMTATHYDRLKQAFPQAPVFLFAQQDVQDPFGGTFEVYQACAQQIAQNVEILIEKLENQG